MTYHIVIERGAQRTLRKLDAVARRRVVSAIDALAANPRPAGCCALTGYPGVYRLRVGEYRIVYDTHDSEVIVYVIRVGHRREVYR